MARAILIYIFIPIDMHVVEDDLDVYYLSVVEYDESLGGIAAQ
jgi:hypothetical protein